MRVHAVSVAQRDIGPSSVEKQRTLVIIENQIVDQMTINLLIVNPNKKTSHD